MKYGMYCDAEFFHTEELFTALIRLFSNENLAWRADYVDACEDGYLEDGDVLSSESMQCAVQKARPIFARLTALADGQTMCREILTYEDYMASNAVHVIFCVDCGCFEVYSKDIARLEAVYEALDPALYTRIEWVYTENGIDRTEFTV